MSMENVMALRFEKIFFSESRYLAWNIEGELQQDPVRQGNGTDASECPFYYLLLVIHFTRSPFSVSPPVPLFFAWVLCQCREGCLTDSRGKQSNDTFGPLTKALTLTALAMLTNPPQLYIDLE